LVPPDLLEAPGEIAPDCVRHSILSWSMVLNDPTKHSMRHAPFDCPTQDLGPEHSGYSDYHVPGGRGRPAADVACGSNASVELSCQVGFTATSDVWLQRGELTLRANGRHGQRSKEAAAHRGNQARPTGHKFTHFPTRALATTPAGLAQSRLPYLLRLRLRSSPPAPAAAKNRPPTQSK
jgi:hypothetical protein